MPRPPSPATAAPQDFANAFEAAFARLQAVIEESCARQPEWPLGVAAAVAAALDFAAADPSAAGALTSQALASRTDGAGLYERLISYLADQLLPGRKERPSGRRLPDITEHAMASGMAMLVAQRIDQDRQNELPATAPEVTQFVLTPYVGVIEARRIAGATTG